MKSKLYTWGTGAAWGRDLGCLPTDRKARNHTSASLLVGRGENQTHFLIDAGVPCVESMIDAVQDGGVSIPPPQAVFITHPHYDHHGDLTKLVLSRENGWIRNHSHWTLTEDFFSDYQSVLSEEAISSLKEMKTPEHDLLRQAVSDYADVGDAKWKKNYVCLNKVYPEPLPIIATRECVNALRPELGFVDKKLSWQPVPELDVWYGVSKENGSLLPWAQVCDKSPESVHPILFKSLPVWHGPSAHGSCLYIFRILDTTQTEKGNEKRVVITGDFATMDESVIQNQDMKNPDILLIENNTAYTGKESTHTNWVKNKALISRWFSKQHKAKVLLYHLSSSYDWMAGCVPRPMTDTDWRELCHDEDFKDYSLNIDVANDGEKYEI